jgi:hypothetical protein
MGLFLTAVWRASGQYISTMRFPHLFAHQKPCQSSGRAGFAEQSREESPIEPRHESGRELLKECPIQNLLSTSFRSLGLISFFSYLNLLFAAREIHCLQLKIISQ